MINKSELTNLFKPLKSIKIPNDLRKNICLRIDNTENRNFIFTLKQATAFGLAVFILSLSGFFIRDFQEAQVSVLDISPNSYVESVMLASNGLSSEVVLNTLLQD